MNTAEIQKAWAEKYRPKTIDELIFPNEHIENVVRKWYNTGKITENALFYGKPGTGKSSLIKILVHDFIKNNHDVFLLGRKIEDIEKLGGWINSRPVASPMKIVVVEEIDRLSQAAFLGLKEKYMERFQGEVAFLGATNNFYKVDPAVRSRFNLKVNFDDLPVDKVVDKIKYILTNENVQFDEQQLQSFVEKNIRKGLRELLNLAQIASITGVFNPESVGHLVGIGDEAVAVSLAKYLIQFLLRNSREVAAVLMQYPTASQYYDVFGKYYDQLISLFNNYIDFDYHYFYQELINDNELPLDIRRIIIDHYQNLDLKIYKHFHTIAMLSQVFEAIAKSKNIKE